MANDEKKAPKAPDLTANGETVVVPKNDTEVAKEGTALGLAGDEATGGNLTFAANSEEAVPAPELVENERLWAMDADHTTRYRRDEDCLKPDASRSVAPGATV